jgi:DNA gyrase subunit B
MVPAGKMRPFIIKPIKLQDCRDHGAGSKAELFIVEGDSAAGAVTVLRNAGFQAALPMQGKPLNALRATSAKVRANELYRRLSEALGLPLRDFVVNESQLEINLEMGAGANDEYLSQLRFERVLMLFDPDADGIHIGALMLMFFYRWMRPLLESGRIEMVRAPLYAMTWFEPGTSTLCKTFAYSITHSQSIHAELNCKGAQRVESKHFRGLGSIDQALLNETCVHPGTRKTQSMSLNDAQTAITVFGGKAGKR